MNDQISYSNLLMKTSTIPFPILPPIISGSKPSHYKFIKVIGNGAFGKVWLAYSLKDEIYCAIKVISRNTRSRNRREKIKRELDALRVGQRCPFIVKLFAYFSDHDQHFIVLEFVQGGDLFNVTNWASDSIRTITAVKFYVAEISIALHHLHSQGYIYRDLKRENVLIDLHGHLKLTDFGLSKVLDSKRKNSFCGTREFMAPEMKEGKRRGNYGFEIDWYALGCLAYEMLMGHLPDQYGFGKRNRWSNLHKLSFRVDLDDHCRDFITSLLKPDPKTRLASLREVKKHPWMIDIDWNILTMVAYEAPIIPKLHGPDDLRYFPDLKSS
ncbi:hypothetical protein CROQUDRAFT_130870 [Cronartium quercuum f. sp. fusiforme G11]|uniref:Protein kinase domain-containing protein n=1 Tax=Cronartium quercuum f. sp. fusiforme G11 TaxID=708437 RepID=A0A9P6TFU8_9BASI|nr:hypothetical protein CROQUDRAFT_130870 [Cronartium quercuum f. sp. fusiforme G11]